MWSEIGHDFSDVLNYITYINSFYIIYIFEVLNTLTKVEHNTKLLQERYFLLFPCSQEIELYYNKYLLLYYDCICADISALKL